MSTNNEQLARMKKTVALALASSITIDQAVKVARLNIGGTVVDAKLKGKPNKAHWRLKLLTAEGPVKVYIDARSGEILEAWSEGSIPLADEAAAVREQLIDHTEAIEPAPR